MKFLAGVVIKGQDYSIRASKHALKRMKQRDVDEFVVVGNILSLGEVRIQKLQDNGEDAIIIDEVKEISIVIAFNKNTISVITVIDKSNVFVKNNTSIVTLD